MPEKLKPRPYARGCLFIPHKRNIVFPTGKTVYKLFSEEKTVDKNIKNNIDKKDKREYNVTRRVKSYRTTYFKHA